MHSRPVLHPKPFTQWGSVKRLMSPLCAYMVVGVVLTRIALSPSCVGSLSLSISLYRSSLLSHPRSLSFSRPRAPSRSSSLSLSMRCSRRAAQSLTTSSLTRFLESEYGTCKTVKARLWPCLPGERHSDCSSCSLLARKRPYRGTLLIRNSSPP